MSLPPTTGLYLRYALLLVLDSRRGRPCSVDQMIDGLARLGLEPGGHRPGKVVSDALRWEVARGRAVRVGPGRYAVGHLPKVTRHRARLVVRCLRQGEPPPLCP
jgi:hypothetical protein